MKPKLKVVSLLIAALLLGTSALKAPPGDNPPRFTDIHVSEGSSISLTLSGTALTTYDIEATTDLTNSFLSIGVVVTDTSGTGSFTDFGALALYPQRFYRARVLQ